MNQKFLHINHPFKLVKQVNNARTSQEVLKKGHVLATKNMV